jgi:DNA polymerase/3'-5' exonuclease PolX
MYRMEKRRHRVPAARKRPPLKTRTNGEYREVVERLSAIIGRGAQGRVLARAFAREGARTRADLKRRDRLARLPVEAQANVLYAPSRHVPLAEARAVASAVGRDILFGFDGTRRRAAAVFPVGSVRRQESYVADLDFLVVTPPGMLSSIAFRPGSHISLATAYGQGKRHWSVILRSSIGGRPKHYRADFFVATPEEAPFALYHLTGSRRYNIRIRAYAKRKGWLLNQYGLFSQATGRRVPGSNLIHSEGDLIRFLGVTPREPHNRY